MAAAVPPIDLRCVRAGPDAPVQSPAAHPLVVATAFLRWGPAAAAPSGAARVQLPQHAMLRVFGRRLRLSASPADSPAPVVCPLDLTLTGTAWARVLNELLARGLLDAAPFSSTAGLQLAIDSLDLSPAALEVKEPDFVPESRWGASLPRTRRQGRCFNVNLLLVKYYKHSFSALLIHVNISFSQVLFYCPCGQRFPPLFVPKKRKSLKNSRAARATSQQQHRNDRENSLTSGITPNSAASS